LTAVGAFRSESKYAAQTSVDIVHEGSWKLAGLGVKVGLVEGDRGGDTNTNVDDLENLGLVQRRPHPRDRRAHALMLTPEGTSVLQKAFQVALDVENALCADLDPDERAQILGLLGKLRHHDTSRPGVHPGLSGQPFRGSSKPPDDPDAGRQSREA
jgi:hypothetical protein